VDLDGDNNDDLLTGTGGGALYLFRGKSPGTYAAEESLADETGKPFDLGDEVGVNAADWDRDGDFDLLVGTQFGRLLLLENKGTKESFAFASPQPLIVDDFPLVLLSLDAPVPCITDWDADGDLDLLIGTAAGAVLYYENIGTAYHPQLSTARTLVDPRNVLIDDQARELGATWGTYARVCATDFNSDGQIDLLVGDHHASNAKDDSLSAEQRTMLEDKLTTARAHWATLFGEYRRLSANSVHAAHLRGKMEECKKRIAALEKPLGMSGAHGYVWLLIRR
jgi:hypothetical protein